MYTHQPLRSPLGTSFRERLLDRCRHRLV